MMVIKDVMVDNEIVILIMVWRQTARLEWDYLSLLALPDRPPRELDL